MNLTIFTVGYQIYLIPTIKITHNEILNGNRGIELIWLKWGICLDI